MTDIRGKTYEFYALEQLSSKSTIIHCLHPLAKISATLIYIICIISFNRYALPQLMPFIFYPVIMMALAEIPYYLIFKRIAIALPFAFFAGISNVFFDNKLAVNFFNINLSYGFISLLAILFRTVLCVAAVLILVATTPFSKLTMQFRRMHMPLLLVSLFEMTYRYIGTLINEALAMFTAYSLRNGKKRLEMRHMGSFMGQLLIRSFERAERIYNAMKCRGYAADINYCTPKKLKARDFVFLTLTFLSCIAFRNFDVFGLFTKWLGGFLL